jgi:hypothetical protein
LGPPAIFIHISITTPIVSALRLEILLYLEPSRSSNGFFKPLLDPDGGFTSETAERRFQKRNGQKFNGYIFNGNFPTDASARSGVTAM